MFQNSAFYQARFWVIQEFKESKACIHEHLATNSNIIPMFIIICFNDLLNKELLLIEDYRLELQNYEKSCRIISIKLSFVINNHLFFLKNEDGSW